MFLIGWVTNDFDVSDKIKNHSADASEKNVFLGPCESDVLDSSEELPRNAFYQNLYKNL